MAITAEYANLMLNKLNAGFEFITDDDVDLEQILLAMSTRIAALDAEVFLLNRELSIVKSGIEKSVTTLSAF